MMKILIDEHGIFARAVNNDVADDDQWECSSLLTAIRALTHADRMQITELKLPQRSSTIPKEMLCDWGVEEFLKPGTVRVLEPLPRAQWEYCNERLNDASNTTALLRQLGANGWEACFNIGDRVYFKRLRGWQAQTDAIPITERCGACISPSPSDPGPYQCIYAAGHTKAYPHLIYTQLGSGPPITF